MGGQSLERSHGCWNNRSNEAGSSRRLITSEVLRVGRIEERVSMKTGAE